MTFNTFTFWVFLAIVLVVYFRLTHRQQNVMLLVASYVFYGWWDWRFLSLLAASTLLDYTTALLMDGTPHRWLRKRYLLLSVVGNLGLLGFFKYFNFFTHEFAHLSATLGLPIELHTLNIILPAGISFYTFQTLSYAVDVYRGAISARRNLIDFALFVSFFPQLVAGPIERAGDLLPQVERPRTVSSTDWRDGAYYIVYGLFLKIFVADSVAFVVEAVFGNPQQYHSTEVLVALYAFAVQLYSDFAGYSLIAIGVARWLGFRLTLNFRRPYFAASPREFWQRWHITLSTWLRDYVFMPLGGYRRGRWLAYRNLMLTMIVMGLWHGAAWTFVSVGVLHGMLLCADYIFRFKRRRHPNGIGRWFGVLVTFHLVILTFLPFRARSMAEAWLMLKALLGPFTISSFSIGAFALLLFTCGPLFLYELWLERQEDESAVTHVHWLARGSIYAYAAVMVVFFGSVSAYGFIYFRF